MLYYTFCIKLIKIHHQAAKKLQLKINRHRIFNKIRYDSTSPRDFDVELLDRRYARFHTQAI